MDSSAITDIASDWNTVWISPDRNWEIEQRTIIERFDDGTETRVVDRTPEGVLIHRRNLNRIPNATCMLNHFTDEEMAAAYDAEALWHWDEEPLSTPEIVQAAYASLTDDGASSRSFLANTGRAQP